MVIARDGDEPANTSYAETLVVLGLAVPAALAVKVPALFGLRIDGSEGPFSFRNASLFVLPLLTVYFVWKRGLSVARGLWFALPFAAGAVSEFGFTANRVAALGENVILLVSLAWSAWLYARFLRRQGGRSSAASTPPRQPRVCAPAACPTPHSFRSRT